MLLASRVSPNRLVFLSSGTSFIPIDFLEKLTRRHVDTIRETKLFCLDGPCRIIANTSFINLSLR